MTIGWTWKWLQVESVVRVTDSSTSIQHIPVSTSGFLDFIDHVCSLNRDSTHILTGQLCHLTTMVQQLEQLLPPAELQCSISELCGILFTMFPGLSDRDEVVTVVTKLPFLGGSLNGKRDPLQQDADSLLQSHLSRYQENFII